MTRTAESATLERGYFLVESLISPEQCDQIAGRLAEYASGARPLAAGMKLQREPQVVRNGQRLAAGADVRKVSALYGDDLARALIEDERVVANVQAVLGEQLWLFRADALMKPGGVGSEKGAHQDSPYWPIEPMSLWSCWMPFDDADVDNGCMMVVPGSHRDGPRAHVRTQDDYVIPSVDYDIDALVPVEMKRGTGLFFHSLLIHATGANTSGRPRRAVTMSYMGAAHRYVGDGGSPVYPRVR